MDSLVVCRSVTGVSIQKDPAEGRNLRTASVESPRMPIYEFVCMECEAHYEELVAMGASADCPDCGSANVRKQLSVFAAHGVESGPASFGGGGGCCGGSCGCGH